MLFDLNKPVLGSDMLPFTIRVSDSKTLTTLGQILAKFLCESSDANPVRLYEWAIELDNNKPITLMTDDRNFLKEWLTNHKTMMNFLKAQFLLELSKQDTPENK